MFKRGISPLIATVLLIGFTVVLSFLVINWVKDSVNDQTDNPVFDSELQEICLAAQADFEFIFFGDYSSGYSVEINNIGPNDFNYVNILWIGPDSFVSNSSNITGFGSGISFSNVGITYDHISVMPFVEGFECNSFDVQIYKTLITYFLDSDGDGYGSMHYNVTELFHPVGYVVDNSDCNDGEFWENPGIPGNPFCDCPGGTSGSYSSDFCDGFDNDCDNIVDENCPIPPSSVCVASDTNAIAWPGCYCNGAACLSGNFCCRSGVYAGSCESSCYNIGG